MANAFNEITAYAIVEDTVGRWHVLESWLDMIVAGPFATRDDASAWTAENIF